MFQREFVERGQKEQKPESSQSSVNTFRSTLFLTLCQADLRYAYLENQAGGEMPLCSSLADGYLVRPSSTTLFFLKFFSQPHLCTHSLFSDLFSIPPKILFICNANKLDYKSTYIYLGLFPL